MKCFCSAGNIFLTGNGQKIGEDSEFHRICLPFCRLFSAAEVCIIDSITVFIMLIKLKDVIIINFMEGILADMG